MVASKVVICKNFNIQPSEIERMAYWEYEMSVKECEKIVEEEKKQQEDSEKSHNYNPRSYQNRADHMMKGYRTPAMPKMPQMPKI